MRPYDSKVTGIRFLKFSVSNKKTIGRIRYEYVTIKYKSFSKFGFEPKIEKL